MLYNFIVFIVSLISNSKYKHILFNNTVVQEYFSHCYNSKLDELIRQNTKLHNDLDIRRASTPAALPQRVEVCTVIESDVFAVIERGLSNVLVSSTTSPIEAGFKLGVEHVLNKLRAGYVVQRSL